MKTNTQIMMERELLEKMDELRRLQETRERVLSFMDNLEGLACHIQAEEPRLAKLLWKVHNPLDSKVDEVTARMDDLMDQIDRLYADMLIQEADVNASIPPAMRLMPPPLLEQTLSDIRSTAPYIVS